MSLDFYLEEDRLITVVSDKTIPIRVNGETKNITPEEYNEMFPGRQPISLDAVQETNEVFSKNITHNLGKMAGKAGIYDVLWRPDENGYERAESIIEPLEKGIDKLKNDPEHFKQFNPSNGWGDYEGLLRFAEDVLAACKQYPLVKIYVSR